MTEASGNGREPLWVREERTPGPDLGAPPGREWNDKFQGGSFWVLRAAELKRAGWVLLTVGERDERNAFDRNIQLAHVGRVAATLLSMSLENVFKAAAMARDWSLWLSELPLYLEPGRSTSQAANIPRKGIQKGELAREITIHDLGRLSMMAGVEARTPDEAEVLEAGTHLIEHWGRYPHAKKGTARSTQLSVGPRFFDAYDRMF